MRDAATTTKQPHERTSSATLDVCVDYAPDDERAARALLLIIGLPAAEIERVVAELNLDSDREM